MTARTAARIGALAIILGAGVTRAEEPRDPMHARFDSAFDQPRVETDGVERPGVDVDAIYDVFTRALWSDPGEVNVASDADEERVAVVALPDGD
jgi:hypothetical protein